MPLCLRWARRLRPLEGRSWHNRATWSSARPRASKGRTPPVGRRAAHGDYLITQNPCASTPSGKLNLLRLLPRTQVRGT
jgi:hypothetical protein